MVWVSRHGNLVKQVIELDWQKIIGKSVLISSSKNINYAEKRCAA